MGAEALSHQNMRTTFALTVIYAGFLLGFFFNASSPSFYPTGSAVPLASQCDLLSNFARLCIPSVKIVLPFFALGTTVISQGGTLLLNFDILITVLTFGALFVGTFILEKNARRRAGY